MPLLNAARLIALMLSCLLLAACGAGTSAATGERRPILEVEVYDVDPRSLNVTVAACEPDSLAVDVEETADGVVLTANTVGGSAGEDCARSTVVRLAEPLDDRDVIDAATGEAVPLFQWDGAFPPPPGIPADVEG